MNRRIWLTIALILAATAVTAGVLHIRAARLACVDAKRLVVQALLRESDSNYIAHVTTVTGYNGKAAETAATILHQGNVEKIEYGHGAWSMTRDGKSYTYLPKGNRLLITEMSRLLSDKDRTALLLANFRVRCVGMDSIAGRAAYVVEIAPRNTDRPSKKLWIDRGNSTILRTDDYSASGDKRGSTEMDKVTFGAKISPKTFDLPSSKRVEYVMLCKSGESADLFKDVGFPVAMPAYVPKGYKLEGYHLLYSTCSCGHRSAQLTYTDGLNVISVFQTPVMTSCCKTMGGGKCDDQNCGIATQGQVTRGDRTIVVVGDLLPKDVRKIAESVR